LLSNQDVRGMAQNPEILPFFPLSVFLLPGEDIPLRIFEPRYRQLIEDTRSKGITFTIPFLIDQEIQKFGSEVKLQHVIAENPGGRMVIMVQSVAVVQILSFNRLLKDKLYAGGLVSRLPCSDPVESKELKNLIQNYTDHFDKDFLSFCDDNHYTRQDVMKALNLSSDDKYRFVCMSDGQQKDGYLARQLRYLERIRTQEDQLGNDFGLN
jgi:Lon protease-like protein